MSRAIYEDVKRERDRLLDKLMQQSFGFQLNDSFTEQGPQAVATVAEPEPEPAQETEEEIQRREQAELMSVKLTRPSRLPSKMEQIFRARIKRRVEAATPHADVKARFEQLRTEVLKSKTVQ